MNRLAIEILVSRVLRGENSSRIWSWAAVFLEMEISLPQSSFMKFHIPSGSLR